MLGDSFFQDEDSAGLRKSSATNIQRGTLIPKVFFNLARRASRTGSVSPNDKSGFGCELRVSALSLATFNHEILPLIEAEATSMGAHLRFRLGRRRAELAANQPSDKGAFVLKPLLKPLFKSLLKSFSFILLEDELVEA